MAISNNILLKKLSGHIDKQIVIKQYGDTIVIGKYPDMSHRTLSPKQLRNNEIMREANNAAQIVMANEERRAEAQVRLNVTRNKLYTALVREYFKNAKEAEATTGGKTKL